MNYSITPTPSYSYVCVAHCRSGERNTPAVTDQLSTIQPRTSFVLCTQTVYHSAPGLFLCRNAQPVHYPVPDFTCVPCSTVHGNLWHLQDPHRNPLTIRIMCAVLPRNGFTWNTFTNTVACFSQHTTRNNCVIRRHHKFLPRIQAPWTVVSSTTPRHRIHTIIKIIRLHLRATFGLPTPSHPDPQINFPYPSSPRRLSFMHKVMIMPDS